MPGAVGGRQAMGPARLYGLGMRRNHACLVALTALALLGAGCSSDDSGDAAPSTITAVTMTPGPFVPPSRPPTTSLPAPSQTAGPGAPATTVAPMFTME